MIFHNPTQHQIAFKIGAMSYSLAPGDECDIPEPLTYVIKGRGLPLVIGSGSGQKVEAKAVVVAPPRFPEGVTTGAEKPEPDEDYPDPVGNVSSSVAAVVSQLEGVKLPVSQKKRRGH